MRPAAVGHNRVHPSWFQLIQTQLMMRHHVFVSGAGVAVKLDAGVVAGYHLVFGVITSANLNGFVAYVLI